MRLLLQITLFLIAMFASPNKINSQNCSGLKHYRDFELLAQFDEAKKKYIDKYKLNNEAIKDMRKYRLELLNERGWDELMSTGTAISDAGVTTAKIARVIKLYCDLILGLAEMMPIEGEAATVIKVVKLTGEQTYNFIKTGKDLKEIVEGNLEKTGYKAVSDQMGIAGKAAKTAFEFYENIDELVKIPEERDKLKSEVERILNMLDNAIYKYQQDLEKSKNKFNDIIGIEQGITKYLKENCKEEDDEIEKLLEKELSKAKKNELTPVNPNSSRTYFMYFFLEVGSGEYFFSPPIPYNINDDPELVKDKALTKFKSHIISQVPSISENKFLWYLSTQFKFDGDISKDWIKTETDCKMFIENEKQKIKKKLKEGSSKIKIIQL